MIGMENAVVLSSAPHHVKRERVESRFLDRGGRCCGRLLEWLATNRPTHHDYLVALDRERPFVRASLAASERVVALAIPSDLNLQGEAITATEVVKNALQVHH